MATPSGYERRSLYATFLIFFILAFGIFTGGYLFYRNYERKFRTGIENQLSSIANLKVDQIVQWRKERLEDAAIFFKNSNFSSLVLSFFEHPDDVAGQKQLRMWLGSVQARYQYDRIALLDSSGVERLAIPETSPPTCRFEREHALEVIRSGQVEFTNFYRDNYNKPIYISVIVPVLDPQNSATSSGAQLVGGMLLFSRNTPVRFRLANLNKIVEQFRYLLAHTIPKTIEIGLFVADDLHVINGDSTQIEQILMNLAINARDAMPDGGRLVIETKNIMLDEENCRARLGTKPGRYVLLSVTDTGTGMDPETTNRIFEPFFTTKEKGKGTGLGLSVVYGIVEQHGGAIACYSELSVGTTFKIYFPAIEDVPDVKEAETKELPTGRSETILVVDDEPNVTELSSRMLTEANYIVITASNGREAIDIYEKHQEQIKLVIMDLNMPVMGGRQLLETLFKINPKVKAVIASGYAANGKAKEVSGIGAKGLIDKPFD
ncbi:MAG: ATP-binding protein, partial [Desulfomonilaceae bacterium]